MAQLKIIQIGNSLGVVLPKDILYKLGAEKGDVLHVSEAPGGELKISAYNGEVAEELDRAEAFMNRYKNTLRALAK